MTFLLFFDTIDLEKRYIMKKVHIRDFDYELVDDDNCFNKEEIDKKLSLTDYFDSFDYIFGDYAYDKVRLKGFYENTSKKAKEYNKIQYLEEYKKNYCSFGSKCFLLKKIKKNLL